MFVRIPFYFSSISRFVKRNRIIGIIRNGEYLIRQMSTRLQEIYRSTNNLTRSSSKGQLSGRKISPSPERIVPDDIYMLLHEQVRIPLSRNYTVHRFLCLSFSKEKPSLGNSRNRTTPLFPRQTIDEHGTHDLDERPFLFYQKRFREKTTRRKEMAVQREEEEEERERASRRNAVVRWFRRTTWKEVGENPWERSCEGRGGGGCTSGEHRGREEACCKEYKQCVLIRAPWPDECTIVTLQGFATPPRPRPAPVPRPKLACAVYQMPRSQMKLIFLTCRGGMVYFRGILIGTMRRIRNFPRRKTSSNRIFPSIRSSVCPARKGIKKRKEIDGEEGRFLSVQLFVREEREKRRKVSSPPPPRR